MNNFSKIFNYFFATYTIIILFFIFIQSLIIYIIGFSFLLLITINIVSIPISLILLVLITKKILNKFEDELVTEYKKTEKEYENAIKSIYDEHIFAITHEMRSPMSVIAGSLISQMDFIRHMYALLISFDKLTPDNISKIRQAKRSVECISSQIEQIENFISNITEHGSYICNKEESQKFVIVFPYLINILMNAPSFSRNMRIFKNNISFGGNTAGLDFEGITIVINPHDLSQIMMNIINNSADAVFSCYNDKKSFNENYEPKLILNCLKSTNDNIKLQLNSDFVPLTKNSKNCAFYILIEDNGPGISNENLNKIFDSGFNITTKKESTHYGFGLKICTKLAEKNDISIFIKTSDSGTIFALGFKKIILGDKNSNYFISNECKELVDQYTEKTSRIYNNNNKFRPPLLLR